MDSVAFAKYDVALAFANRAGAHRRVFALEPDPESAAALAANVTISPYRHRVTIREDGRVGITART